MGFVSLFLPNLVQTHPGTAGERWSYSAFKEKAKGVSGCGEGTSWGSPWLNQLAFRGLSPLPVRCKINIVPSVIFTSAHCGLACAPCSEARTWKRCRI